ncbi:MAG TPA: acyl-CoA dehydrogenase family protein [Stellaceae bacterium]|nr:acyl-CoA dehydrogenase family protein [Stellaceae bacterium]
MPHDAAAPPPAELIARARSFIPKLVECGAETERERRIPHRLIDEMREVGLFRALQPKRWGGYETDVGTYYEIEMALAEGDMSAGWVYGVVGVTQWVMALLEDRAAQDVWGKDTNTLVGLSLAPAGKITPVDGGFRISGRWPFASGCLYCDWALLGAFVPPAKPRADGMPEWRMYLVPKSDYEILDTWHTSGLRGTGSNDIVIKDAFVPAYRMFLMTGNVDCSGPGQAVNKSALYRLPFGQVFGGGVAYPAIGALRAMIDDFRSYAQNRIRLGNRKTTEDPDALLVLGEADLAIDEMKTILHRNVEALEAYAARSEVPPQVERLKYRSQIALTTERCRGLAARLFQVAGAAGLYSQHRFGRILADINAGRQHVTNQHEMHAREWGAYLLGHPQREDMMR